MTFGAVSAGVGGGNKGAKGGGGAAGPNVKSKELAARQQKGAAQANARKRRILGVRFRLPPLHYDARPRIVPCIYLSPGSVAIESLLR